MNVLAFGASNSITSINKKLASHVAYSFTSSDIELIDLNDFEVPFFSVDKESAAGIPDLIKDFVAKITWADLVVISLAEHNGAYTAAFKNIMDWSSRLKGKFFGDKAILLLSTSPGARGGKSVMDAALVRFPIHGAQILGHFSLPEFYKNFDEERGIIDPELSVVLGDVLTSVKSQITEIGNQT